MSVVKFEYANTFGDTVDSAISHYSQWKGEESIIERIENVVDFFEESVTQNPMVHARCPELIELGVIHVRHAVKDGFRILYEVHEVDGETVILVLLFLSQRQSVQNQLIEHCLVYK
jgi:uncharacterized membrane protein YhfC